MHGVARSKVVKGTTKANSESHLTRLHQKHSWLVARDKRMCGMWHLPRGEKARKCRTKNDRSDGQGSADDDIRAEQKP